MTQWHIINWYVSIFRTERSFRTWKLIIKCSVQQPASNLSWEKWFSTEVSSSHNDLNNSVHQELIKIRRLRSMTSNLEATHKHCSPQVTVCESVTHDDQWCQAMTEHWRQLPSLEAYHWIMWMVQWNWMWNLTHWPLGDLDAILKLQFSILFYFIDWFLQIS